MRSSHNGNLKWVEYKPKVSRFRARCSTTDLSHYPTSVLKGLIGYLFSCLVVAKDTSNPTIIKLVLTSLSCFWTVDLNTLLQSCLPTEFPMNIHVYKTAYMVTNPSIATVDVAISKSKSNVVPYIFPEKLSIKIMQLYFNITLTLPVSDFDVLCNQ